MLLIADSHSWRQLQRFWQNSVVALAYRNISSILVGSDWSLLRSLRCPAPTAPPRRRLSYQTVLSCNVQSFLP